MGIKCFCRFRLTVTDVARNDVSQLGAASERQARSLSPQNAVGIAYSMATICKERRCLIGLVLQIGSQRETLRMPKLRTTPLF